MILYEGNHLMVAHLLLLMHCTQCISIDDSSVKLTQNHTMILFELFGFEFESLQQGQ